MTAISLAQRIGKSEVVTLLKETLAEEQAAEQKLRTIGAGLLKGAPAQQAAITDHHRWWKITRSL